MSSLHTEAPKRLRFTADDDLLLLKEFITHRPLEDNEKWKVIQKNIEEITGKMFSIRTIKDHLFLILEIWTEKDTGNRKKSGIEEIYSERDHLLQEVSDICKNAETTVKKALQKRKRGPSKEQQIIDLGKKAREQCTENLRNNTSSGSLEIELVEEVVDHNYYCSDGIPDQNLNTNDELIQISLENELPELTVDSSNRTQKENADISIQTTNTEKQKEEKKKILGSVRTRNNRSASTRKNALDYLNQKEAKAHLIRNRELALEERRLSLDEKRFELDALERRQNLELEKERYKYEIFQRNQTFKVIQHQENLISHLMEKLKKYEA